jgi:hypothetical protein
MTHAGTRSKRLVAVVTPVVQFPLSAEEEISLRHLRQYLGGFDRYIIGLQKLPKEFSDFALRKFPLRYFSDRFGYNRLLLTKEFYEAFAEYEYVLIYQLDCLVFGSNLEDWCGKGWDYVGAPWLTDTEDASRGFSVVGNGGLSLRRVQRALAVLKSKQLVEDPVVLGSQAARSRFIYERLDGTPGLQRLFVKAKSLLHRYGYHNNVRWLARQLADSRYHEDYFWAFHAAKFLKDFHIPAPREALGFSFEMAPRYCLEVNCGRLPFGCHAWSKYDREFWEPYLLE